jgi:hypothetical protein
MKKPVIEKVDFGNAGQGWTFKCPGCGEFHEYRTGPGDGPRWQFNGDMAKPTFTPSLLLKGHERLTDKEHAAVMDGKKIARKPLICHSFVTDGSIKFLDDCSHDKAGQTIPLKPIKVPFEDA